MSIDKKLLPMLKWLWSFSPIMWMCLAALIPPFVVATLGGCGPCGFLLTLVVEILMGLLIYIGRELWINVLRDYTREWWNKRP